jgi:hypothetical protein
VIASSRAYIVHSKENSPVNSPVGATDHISVTTRIYTYHRLPPGLVVQLISIYRTMFPHSTVPDEFYEHVVRKLDDQAAKDKDLSGFLSNGVEALNSQTNSGSFHDADRWRGLTRRKIASVVRTRIEKKTAHSGVYAGTSSRRAIVGASTKRRSG